MSNHVAVCHCDPDYTGDPQLGCVSILYCAEDIQCTSGTKCVHGVCSGKYDINSYTL